MIIGQGLSRITVIFALGTYEILLLFGEKTLGRGTSIIKIFEIIGSSLLVQRVQVNNAFAYSLFR